MAAAIRARSNPVCLMGAGANGVAAHLPGVEVTSFVLTQDLWRDAFADAAAFEAAAGGSRTDAPKPQEAVATPSPPAAPRLAGPVRIALGATLVALLAHAWLYRFLTDDAFISFRYAHHFAQGQGLVFNPGLERVEGYSNFLWVLILAALERAGIAPERAANPLSLLATVGLWWVVVRFTLRHRPPASAPWLVLIPPAFLAASRSVAVWSTSGLETRCFELLATAGLIRLAEETDALRSGSRPGRPWGAILLGLAGLTRPDGALIAACSLAAALGLLWSAPGGTAGRRIRGWIARAWPAVALIAAHHAFRFAYYGSWAPNTYFAKVGGQLRPEAGLEYLTAFVLEYAAFLWVPAVVCAFEGLRRSSCASWIWIASAALLPHLAYVVAIGGDHFEYRPLDVLFPYAALLVYEGARTLPATRAFRLTIAGGMALVLSGLLYLPWRSHADFPRVYRPGFPGFQVSQGPAPSPDAADADRFLDPGRSALTRLPLFRQWAQAHRRILLSLTSHYAGIRQEEHRMFFEVIHAEALAIRALIDRGLLPADIAMAMDCVGAIPYVTRARTLDRLGLTDAHVAHQPFMADLVAHGKQATMEYARERGVDLWFFDPAQLIAPAASARAMRAFAPLPAAESGAFVAPLDSARWLIARFPQGEARARARMPNLRFWNMRDPSDVREARAAAIRAWEAHLDSQPDDPESLDALGFLHAEEGRWAEAAQRYRQLAAVANSDPDPLVNLAACLEHLGDAPGTLAALRGAADRARAAGDEERFREIDAEMRRWFGTSAPGAPR